MIQYEIIYNCKNINPTLNVAKKRLRRNKKFLKKLRISILKKTLLFSFILLLALSCAIAYACLNPNNNKWYILSDGIQSQYEDLSKETIVSVSEFNKDNNYIIHYFHNVQKKDSYLLKYEDKNALLEEHYIYNGIEISLYIIHKNSDIIVDGFQSKNKKNMTLSNYKIKYHRIDDVYYLDILSVYKYKIKINTSNLKIVKELINNFK